MFPIADEQGRVIGFSARCLEQDPKAAKYVNSPETPLFRKSRVLYALDKARRPIVESREAILCEGQIDVIRCHQAGFRTAVAAQGTAFTEEHVRILKRYADSVCVVFDADRAGQDAAMRGATVFMDAGLAVRIATLPPREDPDSFIRKQGAEGFRALLDQAVSAVAFQIGVLSARENVRTEVGLMRVARPVLDMITHCPHAVQRAKLVQEAAERLGLPAGALQEDLRRLLRPSRAGGRAQEEPPAAPAHPAEEVSLCEHLVHGGDTPALAELVRKYLPLEVISDPVCRVLADACLRAAEAGQELQEALSGEEDPSGEIQRLGAQVQLAPAKITGREYSREDAVKDLILFLWRRRFEKERAELARQAEAGGDRRIEARRRQITSHLHHLRRWADGAPIIEVESA
jgi:DNA primase